MTIGREYDVHSVVVYDSVSLFQVVDDLDYPSWVPAWLFDIVDGTVPPDWICNAFPDSGVDIVLGPDFVARDEAAYGGMVELEPEQVDRFRKRVDVDRGNEGGTID